MPTPIAARQTTTRVVLVLFTLIVFISTVASPRATRATDPDPSGSPGASESAELSPPAEPSSPADLSPTAQPSAAPIAAPTIASDKEDYAPGELVTLTGSGWQAGETVEIRVNDDQGMTWNRIAEAVADESGNIVDQFNLPSWFVAVYSVTATGSVSGVATTSFTDARVVLSATLNGGTSVTVSANAPITALLSVQTDGSGANARWRSTSWAISTIAPSSVSAGTCVNHVDHDGAGTYAETITVTAPSTSGTYDAYFKAHADDSCGGAGSGASALFVLATSVTVMPADTTRPTVTLTSAAPNPTNGSPIAVTAQFSETVSGFVQGDVVASNATVSNFVAVDGDTYTFNLNPSGQGTVTADVPANVAFDVASNGNLPATQLSRVYDSVFPTLTLSSGAADPTSTSPIPVMAQFSETVTGFTASDVVATNATVAGFAAVDGDTYTFDLIPAGQGTVTATVAASVAADAAGNGNGAAAAFSRVFDTAAPTLTITTSSTLAGSGWYNGASSGTSGITVAIAASDTTGIASLSCMKDGVAVGGLGLAGGNVPVGDGTHAFSCFATDTAGNTAGSSGTFSVDQTNPVVTVTPDRVPDHNGWYNAAVTFDTAGSDATSGIAGCDADQTYTGPDGSGLTVSGECTDVAGNTGSGTSATFDFDDTNPTISVALDRSPDGVTGWFNAGTGAPVAEFTCSDATSGVASCPLDHTFGDGEDQSHSGAAYDVAGNSASATVSDVDVDLTAPVVTVTPDRVPDHNGWYNAAVTFDTAGSDATSGIAGCDADQTYTGPDGSGLTVSGECTDVAGNTGNGTSATFDFDDTNPHDIQFVGGSITEGGSYYFGFVPAGPSSCSASDNLSGVASCGVTGYGSTVGAHTLTASAYDNANNLGQAFRAYNVLSWTLKGFFSPVDMRTPATPAVWNTVKGGSTVPLKFEVFAGSTELTDVSVVDSFLMANISCASEGGIDAPVEVTTTGNTVLRYDVTEGQFIQNWKTPKNPGKCYVVTMETDDGSTLSAYFKLK